MATAATKVASTLRSSSIWNMRNGFALLLYVAVAIWGIVQYVAAGNGIVLLCYNIIVASIATTWFALDASGRHRFIPDIVYYLVFIAWPVALPIYLIYVLGWRGLGWTLLHTFGLLVAYSIGFYAAFMVLSALGVTSEVASS